MRTLAMALAVLLMALSPAPAAVISARPDSVSVVVYHISASDTETLYDATQSTEFDGLGMVVETRTIDLPAGPSDIQFRGVASTIVPQTADVSGLPEQVDQRNFDYQLLTPGSLLEKSIGEPIYLIRTDRKTGETREVTAILRSGPQGVVLQIGDRFEALNCSGLPERIAFDRLPGGLVDTPTLSVHTNVPTAGRYTITLRYLATGLNWSADYVARLCGRVFTSVCRTDMRAFSGGGFDTIRVRDAGSGNGSVTDGKYQGLAVDSIETFEVPEPSALGVLLTGLLSFAGAHRRIKFHRER